ncbi:hypothetical protein HRI_005170300 [Hibiscus trionum]|uniref:Uncharacterized protein n=1 Tax=Hibiscus trionum TaxID=183268 RepID=A0A9W7MXN5_HIBTR|nr:hypothetical protein HRI_005170300 [Hibiscus trionum]
MGPCAKALLLLLLLLYLDPFLCKVKGLGSSGASSADSAINEMRKLKLEVDTIKDYTPTIPNPKHDPPPRGRSGTSVGGNSGSRT